MARTKGSGPTPTPSQRASELMDPRRTGSSTRPSNRAWHAWRPRAVDAGLAAGCVILMHAEIPIETRADPSALGTVAIVTAALPVLWRSRSPVVAYVLAFAGMYGVIATVPVYNTLPAPVVLCAYAVADRHGLRAAVITAVCSLPVVLFILQVFSPHGILTWGTAQNLALLPLPLALGVAAHARRAYTAMLIERAQEAERSREAEAARRVDEERLRIARDLHDVVAHAMVTINVQAGVGAHVHHGDPELVRGTFRSIKQISGHALDDLRSMLGLLRNEPVDEVPAPPVQRLANLSELRDGMLSAGVDVTLDIAPNARLLPAAVDTTCFRIVQEALTNTLRHAGPTTASVRVAKEDHHVVVEVVDDGVTAGNALRGRGSGHGLRGMRERVAAIGGVLEAGPRERGGWRVAAILPLGRDAATSSNQVTGASAW